MEAARVPRRLLGRILIDKGLVSETELEQALDEQQRTGRRLGEILIGQGLLSGPMLTVALAEQLGVEVTTETGFGTGLWVAIGRRHPKARSRDPRAELAISRESASRAEPLRPVPADEAAEDWESILDSEPRAELESLQARVALLEASIEVLSSELEALSARLDGAGGEHDLVPVREIATMLDVAPAKAGRLTREPGFPHAALVVAGKRLWLREDVRAYADGQPVQLRRENELRIDYLDAGELAQLLGVNRRSLSNGGSKDVPPPSLRIAGVRLWRRRDVEAHLTVQADS